MLYKNIFIVFFWLLIFCYIKLIKSVSKKLKMIYFLVLTIILFIISNLKYLHNIKSIYIFKRINLKKFIFPIIMQKTKVISNMAYSRKYNYAIKWNAKSGCSYFRKLFLKLHSNEINDKNANHHILGLFF